MFRSVTLYNLSSSACSFAELVFHTHTVAVVNDASNAMQNSSTVVKILPKLDNFLQLKQLDPWGAAPRGGVGETRVKDSG